MGARPPRRAEIGPKGEEGQQPGGRHLIEEEREDLQRGGISPVEIFPGTVHRGLLGFFHDPRHQRFLGLLLLFLRTEGQWRSAVRVRERQQSGEQWERIGLGEAIPSEPLLQSL